MKVYVENSVIGGYYDKEFKRPTRKLFDLFRLEIHQPVISELTLVELMDGAPEQVIDLIDELQEHKLIVLPRTKESTQLTKAYLKKGVVTQNWKEDAEHIAIATVHNVDVLVSWNFRHILKLDRIEGFNNVNKSLNYHPIEIKSPMRFIYE